MNFGEALAVRNEYGKILAELGEKNTDIVVLDADLSGSTKTSVFAKKFPDRFFNMGIAEQNMMAVAAGLAAVGKIPFASTFAIFAAGRAFEQVRQSIAYSSVNVKIVASHAGITVGPDGGSHQAVEDIGLMRLLPNMVVVCPADGIEMRRIIETIVEYRGPVYVRGSRTKFPTIYNDDYRFEIGRGDLLQDGDDLTLIGCGLMVSLCLEAAEELSREGINARVINMSSIKPLDYDLVLAAARETGAILTAEEHLVTGGLGGAVCEVLAGEYPVPVKRIGIQDKFGLSGEAEELLVHFGLTAEKIVSGARELLSQKK